MVNWQPNWDILLDNGTLEGELFEGCIEIAIWAFMLVAVERFIVGYCEPKPWFKTLEKQPGGTTEWIFIARAFLNHVLAGALVYIGYMLGSTSIIRHGSLIEFGYETVDLLRLYYNNFVKKSTVQTADDKHLLLLWTCHHLPGILVIIPVNLYLAVDIYFQKIVCILLTPTIVIIPLTLVCKILNLNDLQQRTQFTVCYVVNLMIIYLTRIYYWHVVCVEFYFGSLIKYPIYFQAICIMYYLFLSYFNFDYSKMVTKRLYRYCFVAKNEKEMIEETKRMQMDQHHGFNIRLHQMFKNMNSFDDMVFINDYSKHKSKPVITKLPFRRTTSDPQLHFE